MYNECLQDSSRTYKAVSSPLASKSTTFSGSSSSGNIPQVTSSRCSRESRGFGSFSRRENLATSKHLGKLPEPVQRDNHSQSGCQAGSLDMFEDPRACGHLYFSRRQDSGRDDLEPNVNAKGACEEYAYESACVTESFQRALGSPYYKYRCLTPAEDEIDDAVFLRLFNERYRVDQPPAPPQYLRSQPQRSIPLGRSCIDVPCDDASRASSAGSAFSSHELDAGTSSLKSSNISNPVSYPNALARFFLALFSWACHFLDWARSTNNHPRRENKTAVRQIHIACPEDSDREDEDELYDESVPDSWSTIWIGSEDGDEESEVEAALYTTPLTGLEMAKNMDPCGIQGRQLCEEHSQLDLEVLHYENSSEDHLDATIYSHERMERQSNCRMSSGSPSTPRVIIGLPPSKTSRLINTSGGHHRPFAPCTDAAPAFDAEGNIKLTRQTAAGEALLSNHTHPRWRHYRFSAPSVAGGEINIEERFLVTYLDNEMVEKERLREKLLVKWGVTDRNKLSRM